LPCRKLYKSCSFAVVQTAYRIQNYTRVQRGYRPRRPWNRQKQGTYPQHNTWLPIDKILGGAARPQYSSASRYSRERESAVTGRQRRRPDRGTGLRTANILLFDRIREEKNVSLIRQLLGYVTLHCARQTARCDMLKKNKMGEMVLVTGGVRGCRLMVT
jgi:hypothetical protein